MLTILAYLGIAALAFLLLYFVARRVPIIGDGLAFLCVFASRPLVKLQGIFERAASYSDGIVEKTLRYPPGVTNDTWHGVLVISRNIILAASSIILSADVYQTLLRLPLLFGGAGAVDLPGSFAVPSSLLFVAMSALYGATVLECLGLLPYGAGLFPKMTDKVKKWLGISCAVGFMLSLLFAVLFWVISAYYTSVDPSTPPWLAIPTLALVGIIMTGASVLSLWGMVIGLTGLRSIVFWLLYCGCHILAAIASFVPHMLDVLALHYTQGRMSVYGDFRGHKEYQAPDSPFPASSPQTALSSQTATASLPEQSLSFPSPKENEVIQMHKKVISFLSGGEYGTRCIPPVVSTAQKLQLTPYSSASVDLTILQRVAFDLGVDCSLTFLEQMAEKAFVSNEKDAYAKIFSSIGHKLVNIHLPVQNAPGVVAAFLDRRIGSTAFPMLREINRRLPYHRIVVVTEIAETEIDQPDVQAYIQGLTQLHQEGVLRTTIVTSPRSKFALHHGLEIQDASIMQATLSMLCSPSCVSILDDLSTYSPFVSPSFATAPVALGDTPKRYFWLKWFTDKAVVGNVRDAITQAVDCSKRVLRDPETQAFDAGSQAKSSYLVYNCPFADRRFHEFRQCLTQAVTSDFPQVKALCVSSNGVPYIQPSQSPFLVQVSRFSPVNLSTLTPDPKDEEVKEPTAPVLSLSSEEKITLVPLAMTPDKVTKNSSNGTRSRGRGRPGNKVQK